MNKFRRAFLATALLIALLPVHLPASQKGFRQKANAASAALFWKKGDNATFACSGAVFEKRNTTLLFATADHCVKDPDDESALNAVIHAVTGHAPAPLEFLVSFTDSGQDHFYQAALVAESAADDVAILAIFYGPNVEPVRLGNESKSEPGDSLLNVSYMMDLGKLDLYGEFVAPKFPHVREDDDAKWKSGMPVNLTIAPGSSGSPLFSEKQKAIVGVVVGGYTEGDLGIAVAIPASKVAELRKKIQGI